MHQSAILMHMRTTLIIDDALLGKARKLSGLDEKTALVRAALEALIVTVRCPNRSAARENVKKSIQGAHVEAS
jgi:Arc/MetJ family transcription regulator